MASRANHTDTELSSNWQIEEEDPREPMTQVIVHNVHDLTDDGLKQLCHNYGSIINVKRTKFSGKAFIQFANENEATLAIQQLNSKLGFSYHADFARPKDTVPIATSTDPANTIMVNEDWEQGSVKRRFNAGFSLPLPVNFPQEEPLGTNINYRATNTEALLRQTDPELFFCIAKVMTNGDDGKCLLYDSQKRQKHLAVNRSSVANELNQSENGKCSMYNGLNQEERNNFDAITYCVVCKGYGFVYCTLCNTFYCSVQHQKEHYAEHKLTCTKASNAEKPMTLEHSRYGDTIIADADSSKVMKRDSLPMKAKVFITAVLAPDRIFVRSADAIANREYLKTVGDCAQAALGAVPLASNEKPTVGSIYLAPYVPLGTHGRVLTTEVGPNESRCVFIDHGTVAFIENNSLLLTVDDELIYRKVLVYKVCLADITDEHGEWEKAMEYLNRLKGKPLEMKHRQEAGNMVDVHLRTVGGESVNEKINHLITVLPLSGDKEYDSYVMYEDVPQRLPALGENKSVMILNRTTIQLDGRITWISMDDLPYLENLQRKLMCYGNKVSEFRHYFTPRIGELCLVRCLNRWYRGVCYETAGDGKPALFLCDYGCMVMVDLTDLRKIPPQFATEVRTHDGEVTGLCEAKASGLKLDSFFLDICLPESEPLQADIAQTTVKESRPGSNEKDTQLIMLNMYEFSSLIQSRQLHT